MAFILRQRKRRTGSEVVGATLGLSLLILTLDFLLAALQCKSPERLEAFPGFQNSVNEERVFWAQLAESNQYYCIRAILVN